MVFFLDDFSENYWHNVNNEYDDHHTILFNFKSNKCVTNFPKLPLQLNLVMECKIFVPISTTIFHNKEREKYVW